MSKRRQRAKNLNTGETLALLSDAGRIGQGVGRVVAGAIVCGALYAPSAPHSEPVVFSPTFAAALTA